jgi:hypothetical protein
MVVEEKSEFGITDPICSYGDFRTISEHTSFEEILTDSPSIFFFWLGLKELLNNGLIVRTYGLCFVVQFRIS